MNNGPMLFLDEETGARFKLCWLPAANPIENGGYLIGRIIIDTLDHVIDCFTEIHPGDEATATSLLLQDPYHQWKINREWDLNGGAVLGHWHTHNEPDPNPSRIDLAGWEKMAREVHETSGRSPLMCVIQGTLYTRAWVKFPQEKGGELRELRLTGNHCRAKGD